MLSPTDQRVAIVQELRQRLSVDASSLNDEDLLRQCIPAERVHPQDWHVISVSGCHWVVHYTGATGASTTHDASRDLIPYSSISV